MDTNSQKNPLICSLWPKHKRRVKTQDNMDWYTAEKIRKKAKVCELLIHKKIQIALDSNNGKLLYAFELPEKSKSRTTTESTYELVQH